jgi:ribulose-5-phosphate 4-epimerase/fuculose-1-phosphate aldolase
MIAGHDVAYHDFEGIATELDERERLVADLGTKKAMILRNHGTLACGPSVAETFITMYYLERACEAQIMALSAGPENMYKTNQGVPEKAADQGSKGLPIVAKLLAWPALLRKLDRIDPSFRD